MNVLQREKKIIKKAIDLVNHTREGAKNESEEIGQVDFVNVKSWGSGNRDELGDLQISSHVQAPTSRCHFFERMARHLETLQINGMLEVAQAPNEGPLPEPALWAFKEAHYVQYLLDLQAVHASVNEAYNTLKLAFEDSVFASEERFQSCKRALLSLEEAIKALCRSQAIEADLDRLRDTRSTIRESEIGREREIPSSPSPNAVAIAKAIQKSAQQSRHAESMDELCLCMAKVLAALMVHFTSILTSGNRIGSMATEKLDLFGRGAVCVYTAYPERIGDPLASLQDAVDGAGALLEERDRLLLLDQVGAAMKRTSTILEPLARTS